MPSSANSRSRTSSASPPAAASAKTASPSQAEKTRLMPPAAASPRRCATPKPTPSTTRSSTTPLHRLIRRRPIQRRHERPVEPQVNGQLPPMVGQMTKHRIPKREIPRLVLDHPPGNQEPPDRHEIRVRRPRQRPPRTGRPVIQRPQQLLAYPQLLRLELCRPAGLLRHIE